MWESVRRVGAGLIGAAIVLALGRQAVVSQQPAPSVSPNIYVNPYGGPAGRVANGSGLGQAASPGSSVGRLGYGASPGSGGNYGSLAASYANPSLGYGTLSTSNNNNPYGNGGYGGYGMWGTQWMMNPYQGYLSGAADLTRANAEYYQTIQQAKLTRQEAIRSSIQTRRAMIEEAEWERAHMPDPEKIRQQALARDLDRARHSPPLVDILDARSLNALLRHLIAQQGQQSQGAKVPDVPLSEDTLEHINLTVGDNGGNVGLLKDAGNLPWPLPLQNVIFKEGREGINRLMQEAVKSASSGNKPDSSTIRDLRDSYQRLRDALNRDGVNQLSPDDYLEASRFLGYVDKAITALKSPNVGHFFDGNWKKSRSVAELVQFMRDHGLWFAPATSKDTPAYSSLYNSLAQFDRGMQRFLREGGGGDSDR